jgi:hypothetical protein
VVTDEQLAAEKGSRREKSSSPVGRRLHREGPRFEEPLAEEGLADRTSVAQIETTEGLPPKGLLFVPEEAGVGHCATGSRGTPVYRRELGQAVPGGSRGRRRRAGEEGSRRRGLAGSSAASEGCYPPAWRRTASTDRGGSSGTGESETDERVHACERKERERGVGGRKK